MNKYWLYNATLNATYDIYPLAAYTNDELENSEWIFMN
jgi:hypothetical protein